MPNRFARAPGARPLLGGQHRARGSPGAATTRSAVANAGWAAMRAAWSGQPRNRVARSRSRNRIVRAGSGVGLREQRRSGDEHREQPAAEAARPEERHGDVEALAGADAAGLEPGRGRRSALPWVWITPFGAPRLPEVNRIDHVVGGTNDALQRFDDRLAARARRAARPTSRLAQRRQRGCALSPLGDALDEQPGASERRGRRGTAAAVGADRDRDG